MLGTVINHHRGFIHIKYTLCVCVHACVYVLEYNDVYRRMFNVKQGASMSDSYVNTNIDAFTVFIHKNLDSF